MAATLTRDQVPSDPLPTTSRGTRPLQRVRRADPDALELRPPPLGLQALGWALVVGGAALTVWLWNFTAADRMLVSAPLVLCIGGLGILGFCLVAGQLGMRVRLDRRTETITVTGFRFSPPVTLEMKDVAGVQLCYAGKKHVGDNSFATRLYQLNLVLRREGIERLHLLECGGLGPMRNLARAAAEFMNVPLLEQGY